MALSVRGMAGVQLQYVRVLIRFLQFILLTPEVEIAARPRITGP